MAPTEFGAVGSAASIEARLARLAARGLVTLPSGRPSMTHLDTSVLIKRFVARKGAPQ